MNLIILPTLTLLFYFKKCSTIKQCCFTSSNSYQNNQIVELRNFKKLETLEFNCTKPINMSIWKLRPSNSIILDNKLNLTGLTIRPVGTYFSIELDNFKGFDVERDPFQNLNLINFMKENIWWTIDESKFDFYFKNQLIDYKKCKLNFLNLNFIQKALMLRLSREMKYSQQTCGYIFKNALIQTLDIRKLANSVIFKKKLAFLQINMLNLNSRIFQLILDLYHFDLSNDLLNEQIFFYLTILDINGIVSKIQPDIFKNFKHLRLLRIRTQNIKTILFKNNEWLNFLNLNVFIDWNNKTHIDMNKYKLIALVLYQSFEHVTYYTYPDEDFCYFKNFPHERMVLPVLKPSIKSSCSCTEIFLIQNSYRMLSLIKFLFTKVITSYNLMEYYYDSINDDIFSKCVNTSIKSIILQCNFTYRLKNCQINSLPHPKETYFWVYDWSELGILNKKILSLYVDIVFLFVSIVINLANIIILSNNLIKDKMYHFLKINSYLNLIYCLILIIKYILNNCSNCLYNSIYSQYLNIVLAKLIGNSLKTASNITHISFTLSRYIKITNTSKQLLVKFDNLSVQVYLLILFTFSIGINSYVFFQYSIQNSKSIVNQLNEFSWRNFTNYREDPIDDFKENFSKSEYLVMNIFQYLKIIFSDLFYIILTILIDISLFFFVKKKLEKKRTITANVKATVLNLVVNPFFNKNTSLKKRKKDSSKTSKDRISEMIILNGVNFFIFRFPQAVLSFYGFIFRYDREKLKFKPDLIGYIVCKRFKFCSSLEELFFCFYLSSFFIQFFIFYKLDKNFKESALALRSKILNKLILN